MAISTKSKVFGGTPPYALQLRNNGNTIHTVYGSDDRLEIPDSYITPLNGILRFEITDANNKSNFMDIDKVSWNFMKQHHAGVSVSNGDTVNHINAINASGDRGIKYVGVVYHEDDIKDDAALNQLGNSGQYNHTQFYGSYLKKFDEVVSTAYARGVQIKVSIWCTRDRTTLNNGTTRTMFISEADAQQREDGSPTSKHNAPSSVVVGSYGSTQFKSFVHTLFKNFTKRYLPAILDGTIISYGVVTQNTAEEEFIYLLKDVNNNDENPDSDLRFSRGDFYPTIVNGFKSKYPEYASLSNSQIGGSLLNSSQAELGNKWRRHMEKVRADFINELIDSTLNDIPALRARAKFYQYDSSSLITQAARGNSSPFQRFHRAALIVKSNDDTGSGTNGQRFAMDYNLAAARSISAICMVEPTPVNHDFVTPIHKEAVNNMIALCKARGIHISFVTNNWTHVDEFMSTHNLLPLKAPLEVSTLKTEGNRLVNKRFTKNLSSVYEAAYGGQNIMYSNFRDEYINYLTSQSLPAADIFVADNIPTGNSGGGGQPTERSQFKTEGKNANGNHFSYIKSAGMDLFINDTTGEISDVTPGLNTSTTPNKYNDRNVFYKIDAAYHGISNDGGTIYRSFQNVFLPPGLYTIRRFDCKSDLFPTQASFEAGRSGYPINTAVNNYNCNLSEVTITITEI